MNYLIMLITHDGTSFTLTAQDKLPTQKEMKAWKKKYEVIIYNAL